ncbi:MAG: hypothetical protein RET84_02580 [Pseudomonadota bacterium]|nr:hypothetical protein [Pseudomonadota bacterium]
MRFFLIALTTLSLVGCATSDPTLKPSQGVEVLLQERLTFTALGGNPASTSYYHALLPGSYRETYRDAKYKCYLGDGPLFVLGASKETDGSTSEPLAYGGFCIGISADVLPRVQLFYLPTKQTKVSGRDPTFGDGLGSAVVQGLVNAGAIGYGPKSGQPVFVPKREVTPEAQALLSNLPPAAKQGQ